jgi:hypothetical protein
MILRLLTALIILFPIAAFARNDLIPDSAEHEKCLELLSEGRFHHYANTGTFEINFAKSFGRRNFAGQLPRETLVSTLQAFEQAALWWNYDVDVASSVAEALARDSQIPDLYKKAYLIDPQLDISQFSKDTPPAVLAEAFAKSFARSRMIEFADKRDSNGKVIRGEYVTTDVDKASFARVVNFNEISFSKDKKGRGFKFWGWTYPEMRGMISTEKIFALNKNGRIANSDIRKSLVRLIQFVQEEGGTIHVNYDFEKSLDLAANMLRDDGEGGVAKNSRYFEDIWAIPVARELHEHQRSFSMEAVDRNGNIVANQIGYITGQMYSGDTVYFQQNDPYLARAVIMAGMVILKKMGIMYVDSNVVTPFSKQSGAEYWPLARFEPYAKVALKQPLIPFENRGYSLDEILPYPLKDRGTWLDFKP